MKIDDFIVPGEKVLHEIKLHWVAYLKLGSLIRNLTTVAVLTDRRFFYGHGWITRKSHEMVISKVETIRVKESMWGRILGYGTIRIEGTGAGQITIGNVRDPFEFQRQVRAAQGQDLAQASPQAPAQASEHPPLQS